MSFRLPGSPSCSLFSEYLLILRAGPTQLWSYLGYVGTHRHAHTHTYTCSFMYKNISTPETLLDWGGTVSHLAVCYRCFTAGRVGQERPALALCQFPWCKFFSIVNFKLPAGSC